MPWFRVEDNFHSHPKVMAAGNAAVGLWLRCATYSAQYLTDGHVPANIAASYGRRVDADRLTITGLWLPNGDGYDMHDYLDYNPSADEVRQRRADLTEAKRAGGRARARQAHRDEHGHFT